MFLRESTLDLMRASKEVIYEEVPYKYLLGLLESVYRIRLPGHVHRLKLSCDSCERRFKVGGKTENVTAQRVNG